MAKQVMVIEDAPIMLARLVADIGAIAGYEVCAVAKSEFEALPLLEQLCPEVVVADIQLATGSGLGVLRALRQDEPYAPRPLVVMVTNFAGSEFEERALAAGADAVFDKTTQYENFLSFLEAGAINLGRGAE